MAATSCGGRRAAACTRRVFFRRPRARRRAASPSAAGVSARRTVALTLMRARFFFPLIRKGAATAQQQNRNMATLKQISMRLKSVTNIQKITQSMKMVSAAKYARAERELRQARPYGEGVKVIITRWRTPGRLGSFHRRARDLYGRVVSHLYIYVRFSGVFRKVRRH